MRRGNGSRIFVLLWSLGSLLSCLSPTAGCAPASPVWGGATTTPEGRGDVSLGAAVRVGLGDLDPASAPDEVGPYVENAQGSGVAPAGAFRYGILEHTDLGVTVAGPLIRLDLRQELVLDESLARISLLGGVGPYLGFFGGDSDLDGAGATRIGVDLPLLIGIDGLSIVQLWLGARVGIEHAFGNLDGGGAAVDALSATGFRVGGVFGLALGFRHLHVMLELTAGWETWSGDLGASPVSVSGAVLTPAFALRYRI